MRLTTTRPFLLGWIYLLLTFIVTGCETAATPNMLDPKGPAAARIADLWWLMFWLAMPVFAAVLILSGLAIYRSRRRTADDPEPFAARPAFFLTAGGLIPLGILLLLVIVSTRTSRALLIPMNRTMGEEGLLTIDVIGRQWWWDVRYPEHGIITANEIHIPAGEEVLFRVTSDDVIHSFWVPELHGKIDMMDGRIHTIRLEASEPGIYRGICAEFCGIQHTFMEFLIIAHDQETFADWLVARQKTVLLPTGDLEQRGQAIFFATGCDHCHVIRGVTRFESAIGVAGPDLTHLASRTTLAAGRMENTPQNLAIWILDPHEIKPGVNMPASPLAPEDLEALVAFLTSLE